MKLTALTLATGALIALHAPISFAQATNPGMRLQYSEITGIDNKVYIYGIPTTDSAGKRKTYDAVIEMTAMSNGAPATSAVVEPSPSPGLTPSKIVPGAYKSVAAGTCKVVNFALKNARVQSQLQCLDNFGSPFEASVVSGTVGPGHPFEKQLKAGGINLRPDVANITWGLVTAAANLLGGCGHGLSLQRIVGAQQFGNQIAFTLWETNGTFLCGTNLTKTP
jgi:hypothetical protein